MLRWRRATRSCAISYAPPRKSCGQNRARFSKRTVSLPTTRLNWRGCGKTLASGRLALPNLGFVDDTAKPSAMEYRSVLNCYFSILIERMVFVPQSSQVEVTSPRSVSTETGSGGDGVMGRLQPGQVTVG